MEKLFKKKIKNYIYLFFISLTIVFCGGKIAPQNKNEKNEKEIKNDLGEPDKVSTEDLQQSSQDKHLKKNKKHNKKTQNDIKELNNENELKLLRQDITQLKEQFCFSDKINKNFNFIGIEKGEENALQEFKNTFRNKNEEGYGSLSKIKQWAKTKNGRKSTMHTTTGGCFLMIEIPLTK